MHHPARRHAFGRPWPFALTVRIAGIALAGAGLVAGLAAGSGGCSSPPAPVETRQQLTASIGQRVTVEGAAGRDLTRDGERPIVRTPTFWAFVVNAKAWPEEVMGRRVRVVGTLRQRTYPPIAGVPAAMPVEKNPPYVIEGATWKVVE